jgi:hypothetical protein
MKATGVMWVADLRAVASGSRLVEFDSIFSGFPVPSPFGNSKWMGEPMAAKYLRRFLLISALLIGSSLFLQAQTQTGVGGNSGGGTPSGAAGGDLGGANPSPTVTISGLFNSVVVLTPSTAGTHWTDKLVTAYRGAQCANGCTIEIPDSVADNGSATTPTIPNNVNLRFTGSANFTVCTIHAGGYGDYNLGNVTLTLSGSNCTAISQTNVVTMQTSQKWILHGGKIDCNSQVGGTGVFVGNHTTTVIRDMNFYRCLDATSSATAPTGGLVLFGAQFDWFDNLKFYDNYVGLKLYGLAAAGGGQSNHFNNLTVVGAGNSTTPLCVLLYEQGSTYSMGPNYFTNFTPQSCSVAAMGIIGAPGWPTITYINGGAPERNGGGAASVAIDGVTIKQASTYQNHGFLYWTNVQLAEATINPIVFSENKSQAIFINPVGGNGHEIFSQTDGTSESYVFGKNNAAGSATFQNLSGPTWDTFGPAGSPSFGLANYTAAARNSPTLNVNGSYQNSAAPTYAKDGWTIQDVVPAGANPFVSLKFIHSGSRGGASVDLSAQQVNFANGGYVTSAGNAKFGGTLEAANNIFVDTGLFTNHMLISRSAPTISSGFGSGASVTTNNGPAAFLIDVGTSNTGTGVIGLPPATTGWSCDANDITTTNANQLVTKQTASSTTSATLQNYTDAAATHAWTDSDVLSVHCFAY